MGRAKLHAHTFGIPMKKSLVLLVFGVLVAAASGAMAQPAASGAIQVLSSTRSDVTIRVTPHYTSHAVVSTDGRSMTELSFDGGVWTSKPGAPGVMRLPVSLLLPTNTSARVEIVSQTLDVVPDVDLAPVPSVQRNENGASNIYTVDRSLYSAEKSAVGFESEPVSIFRTAYSQQIIFSPVQYDASTRTVTRVKEATYRISYPAWSSEGAPGLTASERQFFSTIFVNGDRADFYRSASAAIAARTEALVSFKRSSTLAGSGGTWLEVETGSEGVYRISASALATAGISGPIDANTIELLGVGGWLLYESATDSSGEWIEHPFEVRSDGSRLGEIRFYAPGITRWKYSPRQDNVDGLYHRVNPYTANGHFLLHIGGSLVGTPHYVAQSADQLTVPAEPADRVFAAVTYEEELNFEVPNHSRELVGRGIARSDVGSLDFSIEAPGYTGDSTTVRIGYDAEIPRNYTGSVSVKVGGSNLGTIASRVSTNDPETYRNWDNAFRVPSGVSAPLNVSLSFTSSNANSRAMLDWVELMYRRTTTIENVSIPFFVLDTKSAYEYRFGAADGGEVWDVTYRDAPRVLARADGNEMRVSIQGIADSMRRFIAFSNASLASPKLTRINEPKLRETIGQQGAQSIIIAPAGFRQAADSLAHIRQRGGQATEPLNVTVVNLEDIFQEFGYGSRDLAAIRDFLSYTFRHTVRNGTTVPLYVTLFGGGHPDYLNRVTSVPNWLPVWESESSLGEYLGTYRESVYDPYPDDAFFAQAIPHNSARQLDFAIGRISARSLEEAKAYAGKVERYEHASAEGDWRSVVSFVADDRIADKPDERDGIDHFSDTEEEVRRLQSRLLTNKIYGASFTTNYTAAGRRKPSMETAIIDALNNGSVLTSYVGHGNPHVWTHESVLTVPGTINRFTNIDRLSYLTTATCDFSEYDNYEDESGGVMLLVKPDGGAIGLLGTSRSVTGQENLVFTFYSALFGVDPALGFGTASVGSAYLAGKLVSYSENVHYYYLLGDPSQRLLVPRYYVAFDSVNGPLTASRELPALSPVHITGHIVRDTGADAQSISDFNGTVTITLYDTPNRVTATTSLPNDKIVDVYQTEGPILYRGSATVTNGVFSASFIVPKDIKFDTVSAKITALAYGDRGRSALGVTRAVRLSAPDSVSTIIDTVGPILHPFIGTRGFVSGDDVSMKSKLIVDVEDEHGLNTSTASIGHSFIAWVDDDMSTAIDLAAGYVADQDNFKSGTSIVMSNLPAGHHTLHVRAFDTFDNPGFAQVDFVAKKDAPFRLYEVVNEPNPITDRTTFRFTQPAGGGAIVDATLALYTTDGRLVRTLKTRSAESVVEITWDSRDEAGARVANAAYAFHVTVENTSTGTTSEAGGMCVVSH